jgi:hypothetical protein
MDASATRYAARVSMQTGRQEIIVDLKNMVGGRVCGCVGRTGAQVCRSQALSGACGMERDSNLSCPTEAPPASSPCRR